MAFSTASDEICRRHERRLTLAYELLAEIVCVAAGNFAPPDARLSDGSGGGRRLPD